MASQAQRRFTRTDALLAAAMGATALVVYALTLYPDVAGGDSAELVATVAAGGVLHPPGFPLYSLLTSPFAHSPSVAWWLNLFSAACDSMAATLLFLAVSRWSGSRWGGFVAAALFAFAPGVWAYAICAEVFALNNLFVALLLLLAVLFEERRERRYAELAALAMGLGLSNHQVLLFTAVPIAAWMLWSGRAELLKPRRFATLAGLFAVGLLPYLQLPIAASRHAAVSWGAAETWSGFWTHVLRREYGTFHLAASSAEATGGIFPAWASDLWSELGWWGLPLSLLGLRAALMQSTPSKRSLVLVTLAPPALTLGVMMALGNLPSNEPLYRAILSRFWQQPDLFFCAWCGFGVVAVASRIPRRGLVPAACVALAAWQLGFHWSGLDRHRSTAVRDFGRETLRMAPARSLLIVRGDSMLNALRSLRVVRNERPDVRVAGVDLLVPAWEPERLHARYPDVIFPGERYTRAPGGFNMKELLDANIDRMPILICGGLPESDHSLDGAYDRWPIGRCMRVSRRGEAVDVDRWLTESQAALPVIDWTGQPHPPGSWEGAVWGEYWEARNDRAATLLEIARHDPNPRKYFETAVALLEGIVAENPEPPPDVLKNLALAYGSFGVQTAEQRHRVATWWARYLEVAPGTDPDLARIPGEIEKLSH